MRDNLSLSSGQWCRKHEGNIDATCEVLVQEAMNAGSGSTITVVLVHGTGNDQSGYVPESSRSGRY